MFCLEKVVDDNTNRQLYPISHEFFIRLMGIDKGSYKSISTSHHSFSHHYSSQILVVVGGSSHVQLFQDDGFESFLKGVIQHIMDILEQNPVGAAPLLSLPEMRTEASSVLSLILISYANLAAPRADNFEQLP